ncbi:MAG: YfcE family phosphodiesterase [Chloroflexota bacterium]|nr:YfcE family phosphodiesterase [Chloroflexota bacterium]
MITRIGIISDTHIPEAAKVLPPQIEDAFKGVDLILHAGDLYTVSVLDELGRIAPVFAVLGDDDYGFDDERVKEIQTLTIEGLDIFLIHSHQFWAGHVIEYPDQHELEKAPDIVVHGHSHWDTVQKRRESIMINPGSPTFPRYKQELGTVAIIDIHAGQVDTQIIHLNHKQNNHPRHSHHR